VAHHLLSEIRKRPSAMRKRRSTGHSNRDLIRGAHRIVVEGWI